MSLGPSENINLGCSSITAEQAGIKAAVTVASSLDYGMSDSTLKLLVPLVSLKNHIYGFETLFRTSSDVKEKLLKVLMCDIDDQNIKYLYASRAPRLCIQT